MPAPGHGEAHAEEEHPVAAGFHAFDQVLEGLQGDPGGLLDRRVDPAALDQGPQRPEQLEVLAGLDLQEDVRDRGALRAPHVDQDDRAILLAVRDVHALGRDRVAGEKPRMGLRGIAAPENDQIGPVLDFAERRGALAHALEGDPRGAVAHGGRGVDVAADQIGDGDRLALGLAGRVAEPVGDGEARLDKDPRGLFHRLGGAGFLAVDERHGALLRGVLGEPGPAEGAGVPDLGDPLLIQIHGQDLVVADASAKGAGRIFQDQDVFAHGEPSARGSTSTTKFLESGMPLKAVSPPMSWLDGGP